MDDFIKKAASFADQIDENEDIIINILSQYETYDTSKDEISRSIEALRGFKDEFKNPSTAINDLVISTFFPLNLPLYSFVLFAIAPSFFAKKVHVRASEHTFQIMSELIEVLGITSIYKNISIKNYTRAEFTNLYVKKSDVIIFTGRYENALKIQSYNPNALFIYNGSGINPIVVSSDANLDLAADKVYEMRTFNSGQDCAGPDSIFVDSKVADKFLQKLKSNISHAKVGEYGDKDVTIGKILRHDYIDELRELLGNTDPKKMVLNGEIKNDLVTPIVIKKNITEHLGGFHEFFAPVFYILTYDNLSEVEALLEKNRENNMYVSYFGEKKWLPKVNARVLRNVIVNDIEKGNDAYGGYGEKANFVMHNQHSYSRPILISQEIKRFFSDKDLHSNLKVTMLGSGCWEGTPAPFCRCRVCRDASHKLSSKENRTRPEFYVETKKTKFLIEMSPDLRIQSTRFNLPKITNYVISHWHFDHMFGLYELHAWIELVLKEPITIYCSESAAHMLNDQFGFIPKNLVIMRAYQQFKIGDIEITPLPVYHMFSTDEGKDPRELNNTFGFLVQTKSRKIAYLADYYDIPEETQRYLNDCDVVIADGTYLFQEDYPSKPYQKATIEEEDPDHLHGKDILEFTSSFKAKKIVYHSITHLPELFHDNLQAKLPDNHVIGWDGYVL